LAGAVVFGRIPGTNAHTFEADGQSFPKKVKKALFFLAETAEKAHF
jgi:hypothetical protein